MASALTMPVSPMRSPKSPKSPGSPKTPKRMAEMRVCLQLQQFLDEYHYRVMHSSIAKSWNRTKVFVSALELLSLNGIPLTQEDIEWMACADEELAIPELVKKIPMSVRENFEILSQQLLMMTLTATRVRAAVDSKNEENIAKIMEETDTTAIKEQILKEAVIQASREVADILRCQESWIKNMDARLHRLTHASELAEEAQKQLLIVNDQLDCFHASNKARAKKALMGFVEVGSMNSLHVAFSNWVGVTLRGKGERNARKKFEEELEQKEMRLVQLKEKALSNVKSVLARTAKESEGCLAATYFHTWKGEVGTAKREAAEAVALAEIQAKLSHFAGHKAAMAKQVMARVGEEQDGAYIVLTFHAWVQAKAEFKTERDLEAKVKSSEGRFKEFLQKKKDVCRVMLEKMGYATDMGLGRTAFQGWVKVREEEKRSRELYSMVNGAETKYKTLKQRQKDHAMSLQMRVVDQLRSNVLMRVVAAWQLESKMNHIEKYYGSKMDGKRKQLQSVQTLFKSFAKQLEEGLGNIDGDSSGRVTNPRKSRSQGALVRGDGSVSLPDIHARPA